ncbi:MAG: hypothetical protein ACTSPI_00245 [Candidatus Heimdallarchaeaceae archaeon]
MEILVIIGIIIWILCGIGAAYCCYLDIIRDFISIYTPLISILVGILLLICLVGGAASLLDAAVIYITNGCKWGAQRTLR